MSKNTKLITQYSNDDCGPTALLMLFNYFKMDISIYTIKQLSEANADGTSVKSLVLIAEKFGFKPHAYQTDSLIKLKELDQPFIANIFRKGEQHFTVVDEIKANKVVLADPLDGYYKISHHDFKEMFSGYFLFLEPIPYITEASTSLEQPRRTNLSKGLIKNNRWKICLIFFSTVIMNAVNLINIYYFQHVIDHVVPINDIYRLNIFSLILIGLFLMSSIMAYFRTKLIVMLSHSLEDLIITKFFRHILSLPMSFFESVNPGEIIARINDTYKFRDAVATIAITFLLDMIMLFLGAGVLLYINSSMFIVVLILLPIYVLSFLYFNKKYKKFNFSEMEKNAELDSFLVQGISNISDIKSDTNEKPYFQQYLVKFRNMLQERFDLENTENLQMSTRMFIDSITVLVLIWFGAYKVITGQISLGELIAFLALMMYFFGPLVNLIGMHPLLSSASVAIRRLQDIYMVAPENMNEGTRYQVNFNNIHFSNVNLKFFSKPILEGVNMNISKGQTVFITGDSGSGKTSMAKLLMKFIQPSEGIITIDSIDINDIDIKQLRKNVSYIGDSPFLFKGSIYDNLTFGLDKNPSHAEIMDLCKEINLLDFINELSNGLDSKIQDNGSNLSSGQKQRLYIVKSLLSNPSVVILDESTNYIDDEAEESVLQALTEIKHQKNIMLIVINHNRTTWKYADKIVSLS